MTSLPCSCDAILSCVPSLVARGGYQSISYTEIAAMAGIHSRHIQALYPDKSDVLVAFIVAEQARTVGWMQELENAKLDPQMQLAHYVAEWATCLEDPGAPFGVCAILAIELPILPTKAAQALQAYFRCWMDWLTSLLESGARQGWLRLAHMPEVEAKILMATVQGAMLSARVHGDTALFHDIATGQLRRFA